MYILDANPLSDTYFVNAFFLYNVLFIFTMVPFEVYIYRLSILTIIYMCIYMPVPCFLDYSIIKVKFAVRKYKSPIFALHFHNYFGYSSSFSYLFCDCFANFLIYDEYMDHCAHNCLIIMLNLLIHEHGCLFIYLYLLFFSAMFDGFLCIDVAPLFVKFDPSCFMPLKRIYFLCFIFAFCMVCSYLQEAELCHFKDVHLSIPETCK